VFDFTEKWYYPLLTIILAIACFNLFYNLGRLPINSWDEARHGVNAYEMIKRNNYIISTYGYVNDYWNLKPPTSYWAIILGYKLMGFSALGLRIVSSFAALITILLVAIFTLYYYGRLASLISTTVLISTMPFILEHCARTGDSDSLFIFFFTAAMLCMLLTEKNTKWLYGAGLAFSSAFLTKSWHSGNIVIIGVLYLTLSKKLFKLKFTEIVVFILSCTMPILIWGILRYKQDGLVFFQCMINYDFLARSTITLEGHTGGRSFYIEKLQQSYFYWLLVLVGSVMASTLIPDTWKEDNDKWKKHILGLLLWIAVPFILYTKAKTKIDWYILPVYPAMAIVLGASSKAFLRCKNRNILGQLLLSFMILFSFYKNEISIIKSIDNPQIDNGQEVLQQMQELPQYRGKNVYTTFFAYSAENPYRFRQNYVLCAELYGDLIPLEGGVEGFLKDTTDKPLILMPKDKGSILHKEENKLEVVAENSEVFILTK
jgi:4-amino-4-deoxy-L-arabinose transferase-like glycosyltransferase